MTTMAIATVNTAKAIRERGPGACSSGRGVVTTATPWPGRAGGGASGGTGSMAAAMLQERETFAGSCSGAGVPTPPSLVVGSAFIRRPR